MGKKLRVKIYQLLDLNQLTMRGLSRKADIRYATLHALANQKRQNINFGHINRISDAMGITDVREIITFDDIVDNPFNEFGWNGERTAACSQECKRFLVHSQKDLHNGVITKGR
ncbi:helix-turn-helix transcriptional regulator [Bacillaceae bacterium CLA-AA-H227]|uniref:Helix-turn-helix transcriptional regulator n=1 Tax=Robertmurraya yapensis (ex Hitch et al 2024) TaxID=3133160 RepID=A0ACC6S574_9BACI